MTTLEKGEKEQVFDSRLAIPVLACSLPYSTLTMLGIFSAKLFMLENAWVSLALCMALVLLMLLARLYRYWVPDDKAMLTSETYHYAE